MTQQREWLESPVVQGANESIAYALDVSRWGSEPTAVTVVVYDQAGTNVTSTVTTGSPIVQTGTLIYLPTIYHLTAGIEYRVVIKFTVGGHTIDCYGYIRAEA